MLLLEEILPFADTLPLLDELLEVRELEDEAEVLRETLDELVRDELTEPVDRLSLFTELPVVVRRTVPPVLLLRVGVLALLEALLRRSATEVFRLLDVLFTLSVRLEPARTGVLEVMAVRRFSSESTFTMCLFSSREGTFTNPFLRSRRLFS